MLIQAIWIVALRFEATVIVGMEMVSMVIEPLEIVVMIAMMVATLTIVLVIVVMGMEKNCDCDCRK